MQEPVYGSSIAGWHEGRTFVRKCVVIMKYRATARLLHLGLASVSPLRNFGTVVVVGDDDDDEDDAADDAVSSDVAAAKTHRPSSTAMTKSITKTLKFLKDDDEAACFRTPKWIRAFASPSTMPGPNIMQFFGLSSFPTSIAGASAFAVFKLGKKSLLCRRTPDCCMPSPRSTPPHRTSLRRRRIARRQWPRRNGRRFWSSRHR